MHDIPPSIRWLSSRLERPRGIISTTINAVKRDTEALRNAQVQETGRAEERHTEAMEGQKQLKIAAYRAALEEYTRDRVPLDWARSTGSQGVALMLIAERLDDATRARTAVQ
jgi:hypothetical protein